MPHQWLEGNLPVSAKCYVCDKTCGSVLRLQDWRCLWCKAMVRHLPRAQLRCSPAETSPIRPLLVSFRCTRAVKTCCPPSVPWVSVKCPSSLRRRSTASTLTVRQFARPVPGVEARRHSPGPLTCAQGSGRRPVPRPVPAPCWCLSTLRVETIRASSSCDASSSC